MLIEEEGNPFIEARDEYFSAVAAANRVTTYAKDQREIEKIIQERQSAIQKMDSLYNNLVAEAAKQFRNAPESDKLSYLRAIREAVIRGDIPFRLTNMEYFDFSDRLLLKVVEDLAIPEIVS